MSKKKKKSGGTLKKVIIVLAAIVLLSGVLIGYNYYTKIYRPNVSHDLKGKTYFYIHTGATYEEVLQDLKDQHILIDLASFDWVAGQMKYKTKVYPGRYRIKQGMSNKEIIRMLRSGEQEPVKVVFTNVRTKEQLAGKIAGQIEADSTSLINTFNSDTLLSKYDLTPESALALFIPNTYEFYWNTSASEFVNKMGEEYQKFWTSERKQKAQKAGLNPRQVSILASIVQSESNKSDEKPTIAGVYLNRLKKDCLLEADPTLVFACGDFTIKRVLNVHKQIDSPYNTYKYKGLPPGPICLPSISSLEAVLNFKPHEYMYFCAKEDLSGYHNFAVTLSQHLENARKFHSELDRRNIKK